MTNIFPFHFERFFILRLFLLIFVLFFIKLIYPFLHKLNKYFIFYSKAKENHYFPSNLIYFCLHRSFSNLSAAHSAWPTKRTLSQSWKNGEKKTCFLESD